MLGSAYVLGASEDQLQNIFDEETKELEPWKESPSEVGGPDWWTFRGSREHQRAFVDFFEDQLVLHNYDWKALAYEFMYEKQHKLINGVTGGCMFSIEQNGN
jgi:hypothetical protein